MTKLLRLVFILTSAVSIAEAGTSLSCSTTQNGVAVINEVNANDNFVEIYLLQAANILNWGIYLDNTLIQNLGLGNCTINGAVTLDNAGGTTYPAGTFIVCTDTINPSKDEILLVDKSGAPAGSTVIDYLGFGKLTPSATWSVPSECGTLYPDHNANNKDIARVPDGTGTLTDNGNEPTLGGTNGGGGGDPTPILEYKFDACSLASTVEDTQGSYHGTATGTGSTNSASVLGGRALDLNATDRSDWVTVPKEAVNGLDDFSFSVWIKTGSSDTQLAIFQALGADVDDDELEIYIKNSNEIQINIKDGSNALSANQSLTDNLWHHLLLTRQSDSICLYVDGSLTECNTSAETGALSVTIANSVVIGQEQDATRVSPSTQSGFSSTQSFKGYIDELKIYDSILSSAQALTLYNDESTGDNSSTCSGGGGDTVATNFNCVKNGANGISGNLYTKTTAQSFRLDVVALQDASTIESNFASGTDHTLTVELVDAETAASCDSYPVLTPAISQTLNLSAANAGTKTTANMTSSKAYREVKCRVTDATDSPAVIGCSTDSFAIRPTELSISSSLTNASSAGLPKAKAGDSFTLTATAITTASDGAKTTTLGYNGTPSINSSNMQAHAGAIQTGSISGTFSVADVATGIATGTAFSYSEVGLLQFTAEGVYDDSFTAVDQPDDCTDDFSNTKVSGAIGCKFGNTSASDYFGRFTPDHFKITAFTDGVFADACTGFTYTGQTFSYQTAPTLTVTAYNGLSTPSITENYTGSSYAKLIATDFNVTVPTTDSTQLGADSSTLINLESWTPGSPTLTDNGNGSLTFAFGADDYIYQHENNSKIASFIPTVDLSFSDITDSDGIQTQGLSHTIQASGSSIRFGRLNIDNAHGSELMALSVPVYVEHYNGTSFVTSTDDLCTTIAVADLSFNGGTNPITVGTSTSTASIANSPLVLGIAGLSLSAPGETGYIDIASDIFITSDTWLGFDWDGDGDYDDAPSARATFGIYKGNSKQIYFREVY